MKEFDPIQYQQMKQGSKILVSCRSRNKGEQEDAIPLPLDKEEIDSFIALGLEEQTFLVYDDEQEPSVPHFFASYIKYNKRKT